MIRALKHLVRHEWRTHPSVRTSAVELTRLRPDEVFDHHFCAYPGCDVERLLVWSNTFRDFVWRTVTP